MLKLALDAMGGDVGPKSVVEGACFFLDQDSSVSFQIFGDEAQIKPHICAKFANKFEIIHTEEKVSSDMKPSTALRRARKSSMALSIDSVAKHETSGVISGGNTGAFMVLCLALMGNLPGIFRPAIAAFVPSQKGGLSTMLDLGANSENDEFSLIQFAIMGEILARIALGIQSPRVGLLNIGTEELKGNATIQKTYQLCKTLDVLSNFCGFVEGNQILTGDVDVIVTDGFTGNIALKTLEGTAHAIFAELKKEVKSSFLAKIAAFLAYPSFRHLQTRIGPSNYNGAVFLGVKGIAVKSHGNATAQGFANAIKTTKTIVGLGLIHQLEEQLKHLPPEFFKR